MSITAIISTLATPISNLLSEFIVDKDERNRLAHEIATMSATQAHEQAMAQIQVNQQEAAHKSLFVAGARPAALWVCVFAMAFNYIGVPLGNMALEIFQVMDHKNEQIVLTALDFSVMAPVMLGLLGLGGMRSFEKAKGVARER